MDSYNRIARYLCGSRASCKFLMSRDRLNWLLVSFLVDVNYLHIVSYHIVSYRIVSYCKKYLHGDYEMWIIQSILGRLPDLPNNTHFVNSSAQIAPIILLPAFDQFCTVSRKKRATLLPLAIAADNAFGRVCLSVLFLLYLSKAWPKNFSFGIQLHLQNV